MDLSPLVADDHDHRTQDEVCTWCGDLIGLCAYIRGVAGDPFHAEPCWREVTEDRPAPVQTAADRAADMDEAVLR